MKKRILCFIVCFSLLFTIPIYAANDEDNIVPFEDPRLYEAIVEFTMMIGDNVDRDGNGITYAEAAQVMYLDLSNSVSASPDKKITSLKGIEAFVNLDILILNNNDIKDISPLYPLAIFHPTSSAPNGKLMVLEFYDNPYNSGLDTYRPDLQFGIGPMIYEVYTSSAVTSFWIVSEMTDKQAAIDAVASSSLDRIFANNVLQRVNQTYMEGLLTGQLTLEEKKELLNYLSYIFTSDEVIDMIDTLHNYGFFADYFQ